MIEPGPRKCACGCNLDLPPDASLRTKYRPGHKHRAYRERHRVEGRKPFLDGLGRIRRRGRVVVAGVRRGQGYA